MASYEPPAAEIIAESITDRILGELVGLVPGWTPEPGDPIRHVAAAVAVAVADMHVAMIDYADSYVEEVGAAFGRPPRDAVAAQMLATVTASDTAGHTLPAGSTFVLTAPDGGSSLWTSATDVPIAPGDTETAPAAVVLTAEERGVWANTLTGSLDLVSPRQTWFAGAVVATPASGGVDAEDAVEYRDAVARYLRGISPRAIHAADWETHALEAHEQVGRVMVLETWDAASSVAKALHVTVAVAQADGTPVGVDAKNAVQAIPTVADVVVHVIDPSLHTVNVEVTVTRLPGFDAQATEDAVVEAVSGWLDPAAWGLTAMGEQSSWRPETKVRIKAGEAAVARALPVDFVESLKLQVDGVDGSMQTTDRTLSGVAPLAKVGTVTVTVHDPA